MSDTLGPLEEPIAPDDPGWRRRRREHDVKHLFAHFSAELDGRAAIKAAAQHIDTDPAWQVREEWAHDPKYLHYLAFWSVYRREYRKG